MKELKKIYSKNNNEIVLLEQSPQNYEKTMLIIGVVHGDEPQGKFLIEKYLEGNKVGKNRMLFIPCLNPDGLASKTRHNSNGVDINRNFPTKNWKFGKKDEAYYGGDSPGSEIETEFVLQIIDRYKPSVILTLHTPYKVVNYDGPAEEIAKKISEIIDYPVEHDIGYPTPGSFGTFAGIELKIPTITLELDEEIDVNNLVEPATEIFDYLANYQPALI